MWVCVWGVCVWVCMGCLCLCVGVWVCVLVACFISRESPNSVISSRRQWLHRPAWLHELSLQSQLSQSRIFW